MTRVDSSDGRPSIAEQLEQLKPQIRKRFSSVVPISQVTLSIRGKSTKKDFESARDTVLRWIAARAGRPLPENAWTGESFELEELGAQRVAAIMLGSYWAARLDDADSAVAQRTWVTEVGIAESATEVVFGARLVCAMHGAESPFERSVPGFVRGIIDNGGAYLDGVPVRSQPRFIDDEGDVEGLVGLLRSKERRCNVIVFSLPENCEDPSQTAAPAPQVALRALGAAHVAILTGPASYGLSDRVGREFSVYHQGVRTYRPGFDPSVDEPFAHPLGLPHRIATWPGGGAAAYASFLIGQALAQSVDRTEQRDAVPAFSTVRQAARQERFEQASKAASSESEALALATQQIESLAKDLAEQKDEYDTLLETADKDLAEARDAQSAANARAAAIRYRLEALQSALESRATDDVLVSIPDTLEPFEDWCAQNLGGVVEVTARARGGAKKSVFQDIGLIYKSLLMLRDHYVPMRRDGGAALRAEFDRQCRHLGLEETATFSGTRYGEQGDTYFVQFAGRKRLLDRHLKNGNARDPNRCFRLYFFWDEESEQVVVGWLPSHLTNRMT